MWEIIADGARLRVPGGWLYRLSTTQPPVFVPLPSGAHPLASDFLDHHRRIVQGTTLGIVPGAREIWPPESPWRDGVAQSPACREWSVQLPQTALVVVLVVQTTGGTVGIHQVHLDGVRVPEIHDLLVVAPGLRIPLFWTGQHVLVRLYNDDYSVQHIQAHLEVAL